MFSIVTRVMLKDQSTAGSSSRAESKTGEGTQDSAAGEASRPFNLDEYVNGWVEWGKKLDLSKTEFKMPSAKSVEGLRYYSGGFEEKMTRREAAQILGVRESTDANRIKQAHRKILIANHPDKGGSPYMASKINEVSCTLI
jgi:hypothetical protein